MCVSLACARGGGADLLGVSYVISSGGGLLGLCRGAGISLGGVSYVISSPGLRSLTATIIPVYSSPPSTNQHVGAHEWFM